LKGLGKTLISQSDENAIAVDSDLVAGGILGGWHTNDVTRSDIELGTVPRTYDTELIEFAIPEGAAVVGA